MLRKTHWFSISLAVVSGILSLATHAHAQFDGAPPPKPWFALDVDVSAALRFPDLVSAFHLRGRVGYSHIARWRFYEATATAEYFTTGRASFGLMGSITSLSNGFSGSLGATWSLQGRPGLTALAGFGVFYLEGQLHFDEPSTMGWVSVGLRIPLGPVAYALWDPPRNYNMEGFRMRRRRAPSRPAVTPAITPSVPTETPPPNPTLSPDAVAPE